jgi:hypothetical protein
MMGSHHQKIVEIELYKIQSNVMMVIIMITIDVALYVSEKLNDL